MSKYGQVNKLSKSEQDVLFADFARSLSAVRSSVEAANFIRDLLSEQEAVMFARRLQIARLLEDGITYDQIRTVAKVGFGTIARVHTWLQVYGEGYRLVLSRTKKRLAIIPKEISEPWRLVKRKYPMHFWPQLLLEEIIKSASQREREKLRKVVQQLRNKTKLSKDLLTLLN